MNETSRYSGADPNIASPGQHPLDPTKQEIDPVAFALDKVQTYLLWIEEHRASFENLRQDDASGAETELAYLKDSTLQGLKHLQRLSELLMAGHAIDAKKRLPDALNRGSFSSVVNRMPGPDSSAGPNADSHEIASPVSAPKKKR
jgi:hypothetical protein